MAGAVSPSSSPRLPSPPPMAEDQVGPTSPGIPLFDDHGKLPGAHITDAGASRRIRPGTRAEDMAEGPPLVDLQDIDSAFQLTEHLKALHSSATHPPGSNTVHPVTAEIAKRLATPPPHTSRDIWLYELGRLLIHRTNAILVALFADGPPCSAATCPEMRASEWQYLCAVHDPPKSCAAIDYCCHTLDWAATTLTSSKMFPSRLGLGSGPGGSGGGGANGFLQSNGGGGDKVLQQQMKEIKNIFRRVYRIYAHAWFQHREMFWRVEAKTGLYVFFKTVCDEYGIIESENYTIPPEAEGGEPVPTPTQLSAAVATARAPTLLRRDPDAASLSSSAAATTAAPSEQNLPVEPVGHSGLAPGATTKRHRHTMSDRSVATVIQEEMEEEDDEEDAVEERNDESHASVKPLGRSSTAIRDVEPEPEAAAATTAVVDYAEGGFEEGRGEEIVRSPTAKPQSPPAVASDSLDAEAMVQVKVEEAGEDDDANEESEQAEEAVPIISFHGTDEETATATETDESNAPN